MKRVSVCGVYSAKRSAQSYLCAKEETENPSGACGSACGAGDDNPEPKPAACGSACGAGDK
ncbi:MAG: ACGX-repeat peptide [Paraprevotella sp.]|nr:ACGX-repeat peptide [Paraprevotella sp.]